MVDEVELFNRALSATEIQAIFAAGTAGKCKNIPVLLSASANTGQQGQQNLSIAITGQNTHFVQGTTTASFGAGITVASVTVNSPTSATAVINIDPAAMIGARTVTLTTSAETVGLANSFTVTAGMPALTLVSPNTGQLGQQNLSVALTGQNTHFVQGTTQVSFGVGITVSNVTVSCPTCLTVTLAVAATAPIGPHDVTVTTGSESETLTNGFTVNTGTPAILSVNPSAGQQGQQDLSVNITGQNTHFVEGSTQATFGAGITVTNVIVADATHAAATVNITGPPGPRDVTMTTGNESVSLFGGFTVAATILYSANAISSDVWAFTIDPSTGALTRTSQSPFPLAGKGLGIALDPSNQFDDCSFSRWRDRARGCFNGC